MFDRQLTHSMPEEVEKSKESNPYRHHHSDNNHCLPFLHFSVLRIDDIIRDFPFPPHKAISKEFRRLSHQRSADDDSQGDDPDHDGRWNDKCHIWQWDVDSNHDGRMISCVGLVLQKGREEESVKRGEGRLVR